MSTIPMVLDIPMDVWTEVDRTARNARENPMAMMVAILKQAFPCGGLPQGQMPPQDSQDVIGDDLDLTVPPIARHDLPRQHLPIERQVAPAAASASPVTSAAPGAGVPRRPDGTAYDDMIL